VKKSEFASGLLASTILAVLSPCAFAQSSDSATAEAPAATKAQQDSEAPVRDSDAIMGEIVVTANKKNRAEQLQQVPASIAAFGGAQLEAMQFRNLESLTVAMPNVELNGINAVRGVASFSIRGLGVNSSVPSIEPTVGTFINGVYIGTNWGVLLDTFDVDAIEVLRGPQGVLFGRNVTGGAISLRTARPDGTSSGIARASLETGLNQTYSAAVQTALIPDKVFARVAGYYSHDDGYFKDPTLGRDMGRGTTWFIRPTLVIQPVDSVKMDFIGEYGKVTGDGAVNRNPRYTSGFTTVQNNPTLTDVEYKSGVWETNIDTSLGDGVITNILGYREVESLSGQDADATSQSVYHIYYYFRQHQFSNELRYAGRFFDRVDFVTGGFYFQQKFLYLARDELNNPAPLNSTYGGQQRQHSWGIFANTDVDVVPDKLVLTVGARYSVDRKAVNIATRNFATPPCSLVTHACVFNFNDAKTFRSFTPKVNLKWTPVAGVNLYGLYTKGFRSGGYNVRAVTNLLPPGPFNDEVANNFEVGAKLDLFDRRVRLNLSAYHNTIKGMQREQTTNTVNGIQTIISNTADARLQGLEAEATVKVADGLVLRGSVGVIDGKYTKIFADLNGDGRVDSIDQNLKIPRLAPLTFGISALYDTNVAGFGGIGGQVGLDHRDATFFNDNNSGPLPAYENLTASLHVEPEAVPGLKLSVYGKNLLNADNYTNNTPLGTLITGGAVQFPGKGRVIGGEIEIKF
jgi:iron complex outermembrane receptor protein